MKLSARMRPACLRRRMLIAIPLPMWLAATPTVRNLSRGWIHNGPGETTQVTTIRNHPRGRVHAAVLAALALPMMTTAFAADTGGEGEDALQEITVTATRREESLSKVPISIAAISQKDMDSRGLKQIDGL